MPSPRRPDLRLDEARGRRQRHVGRQRPTTTMSRSAGSDARVIKRFPGGLDAKVGIRRPRLRDVAGSDPGALVNPRVVVSTIFSRSRLVNTFSAGRTSPALRFSDAPFPSP